MENWRDVVASYPDNPEPKDYAKAIRTAIIILKEDLASFEAEWFIQTLVFKPIGLFDMITSQRTHLDWQKSVKDSFKLLKNIVEKYWDVVENYSNEMIELCMLPFDTVTRPDAILCLQSVVKHPNVNLNDLVVGRLVSALEEARTCKAPLAQLIGTICRYQPAVVQEHYTRIWRTYLNMLACKTSDELLNSVLKGINGLFVHFGDDMALDHLNNFYDKMSKECIKIPKCLEALLSILEHHARLFKERLAEDKALRLYLWQFENKAKEVMDALSHIYEVIFPEIENTEDIIKSEIIPHIDSDSVLVKHTALRILIQARRTSSSNVPSLFSGIDLEFLLRAKKLSYEEANTVSWCIRSSVANSETMLRTAILFYDNLPTSKKTNIIVDGILKASEDIRKAGLGLLLQLSLQGQLDRYIDVWRVLLDNATGPDLEKAVLIIEDALHHILELLAFCVEDTQKVYTDIRQILSLMSVLLSFHKAELNTSEWCVSLRPTVVHLAKMYGVDPVKMITETNENEIVYVEKFEEDTVLSKLLSTLTETQDISHSDTLSALQIIFSKTDPDVKVLSKALYKMELVMQTENNNLDKRQLSMIIKQILRLKSKSSVDNKDARIFQKDVTMFLGKYGQMACNESFTEDVYVLDLKNKITLDIPNIVEGTTFKIDLQRVLQLCLLWEEPEILHTLLVILTANVSARSDPGLRSALVRVIIALCRLTTPAYHVLTLRDSTASALDIMKAIAEEPCPNVRRKLSECLEALLTHDPGSETTEQLLDSVREQALLMLSSEDDSSSSPGLDITRAFLSTLPDNNKLTVNYLPKIIIYTSNAKENSSEIFEKATNIFLEKIDLFSIQDVERTLIEILDAYASENGHFGTNLDKILGFTKLVVEIKGFEPEYLSTEIMRMCAEGTIQSPKFLNLVTILAALNTTFDFDSKVKKDIVWYKNGLFLEELLKIEIHDENDDFKINAALVFLKEFVAELNEMSAEKTLQCFGNIIENIPPRSVLKLKNSLTACVSVFKTMPDYSSSILTSYETWCDTLELQNITENIEEKTLFPEFSDKMSDIVHAIKIMSDVFDVPTHEAKSWTALLLKNLTVSEIKWGRLFVSDLLAVSEKNLTVFEFQAIFENNLDFVKNYINVYFKKLILKPYVLKDDKSGLVIEILKYFARTYKEEEFQNVLDLVNHLWPSIEENSSFDEKVSVLRNLHSLPKKVSLDCLPVKWATTLLTSEGTRIEDKIKLIASLQAGEKYSIYYSNFASCLPARLSEMQGQYIAPFRALIDSLAVNGDMTLLEYIIRLSEGDDTEGWWDHAIDACMSALATKEDTNIFTVAYEKTKLTTNLGICNRILLPFLRHSSRKSCEKYIASILPDIRTTITTYYKEATNTKIYIKRLVSYAIAFKILKVAFEKIPTEDLKSGILNKEAGSDKPWFFLDDTCMKCVTLSKIVQCPTDATDQLRETYLGLQCSLYNFLTIAICRRKLTEKLCARLFDVQAWANIVDNRAVYTFELRANARYRATKPSKQEVDGIVTSSSSFTGTFRTRLFLTTLSEDPLQYDMIHEEKLEEEDDTSLDFEDSVLNAHGCLSTITYLFEHASILEHTVWRSTLVSALTTNNVAINVKWLLAQAICNAEESLKPHASALCPALFQLIAETSDSYLGKNLLNNLHIDIISTIIKWDIRDVSHNTHLDSILEYLIHTCLEYKNKIKIHRRLLNVLNSMLQLYGKIVKVNWNIFQDYCQDLPNDIIKLFPIFERLLKNGVSIPELLPAIFSNSDPKFWIGSSNLAKMTGLALFLADSETKETFLPKFRSILSTVRNMDAKEYVKMLFYVQGNCSECCDLKHFEIITSLANTIEKSRSLTILSKYLETNTISNECFEDMFQTIGFDKLFDSEQRVGAMKIARNSLKYMDGAMKQSIMQGVEQNCKSSDVLVRREAFSVILKAFQELIRRVDSGSSKRKALDSTPILDMIDSENIYNELIMKKLFDGLFDSDEQVSRMLVDGIQECISKDIPVRFAELFFIIVYQCSVSEKDSLNLSECGARMLEMLLSDLRDQDAFKDIKLRDEPLPPSVLKPVPMSTKTYATLLRSGVAYRQKVNKAPERREINVQMPITEILDVFLQLSKTNSQICQELCVQMMKCLQGKGRRFDLDSVISKQLFDIMRREPTCLTPLVLDACRVFVNGVSSIQGFKESVQELKQVVANSEGYSYTNILYEDLVLRSEDRSQFTLRILNEDTDATMRDEEFSVQGLIKVFGTLSNWDDLRIQDKRQVEDSLPPLWSKDDDFTMSLRNYFEESNIIINNKKLDYKLWFHKMIASFYSEEVTQDRISWLKQTEKWPKRNFVTSAIIEAIQWHQIDGKVFGDINQSDCLGEWAARLMIRSAHSNQSFDLESQDSRPTQGSTSKEELFWCREANRRCLPQLALQCIERNKECLLDVEILPWVLEKVIAYRTIRLRQNNSSLLQNALENAKKQAIRFASQSSFETNIGMKKLILQLYHDLGSLSKDKLDDEMKEVSMFIKRENGRTVSSNNAQVLKSFYESAMVFYDQQWNENDELVQSGIIQAMTDIIDKVFRHDLTKEFNLLISPLLNRLLNNKNNVTVGRAVNEISKIFHHLDFFSSDILKKLSVNNTLIKPSYMKGLPDTGLDEMKKYFQLICDTNHSLLQYCDHLKRQVGSKASDDESRKIFEKMKKCLFETTDEGSDYQSLNTLKNRLYAIENMNDIDSKVFELNSIIKELKSKPVRSSLRLSQLSPKLCSSAILESKRTDLQKLLRLPTNLYIVNFFEQVTVFADSIRHPCVVKARLSDGSTRQYIIKSGEPMLRDASVQRATAILSKMKTGDRIRSYNVTPLSDDSALIEYLEDHRRLRDLMGDIGIDVPRMNYEELILAPSLALEHFNTLCKKVTPYKLRSSIENKCSCVEEFIEKKRTFEDTLSSMTIINWLFGLGDRHLHNIMFSERDGGVCGVDWASIFQYGRRELPPARLTANLLAVCDVKVLESRLQSMLLYLRDNQKLYEAFIRTSFYYLEPEFNELKHVHNILEGKSVSYQITRECIDESDYTNKDKYMKLLDEVFENFTAKESYSVEEQVSCLLQHCTDPRILAVTQPGWEAWL